MRADRTPLFDMPLSPVQQGMIFHHYARSTHVYLEQMICEVVGELDLDLAAHSLDALTARHECLRTIFVDDRYSGPRQVILEHRPAPLRYRDCTGDPDPMRHVSERLAEGLPENMDIANETSHCELFRTGRDRYVFLWTYHHLIMDAWTIKLLQEQFCRIYLDALERRSPEDSGDYHYRHYLDWIEAQDGDKTRNYWRNYLAGGRPEAAEMVLPADDIRARTVASDVMLDPAAARLLHVLAKALKTTVNSVLLAAWGTYLLHRYHRREVLFGCVVSGRMIRLKGADRIGGLFVNALPVRLSDTGAVSAATSAIQRHLLLSSEYAYLSLSDIMACGDLRPSSLLTVINFSIDLVSLEGGCAAALPFRVVNIRYNEQASYAIYLDVFLGEESCRIAIHHDRHLYQFDAQGVQDDLTRILESFRDCPEATLRQIVDRLADAERPGDIALDFGAMGGLE